MHSVNALLAMAFAECIAFSALHSNLTLFVVDTQTTSRAWEARYGQSNAHFCVTFLLRARMAHAVRVEYDGPYSARRELNVNRIESEV